MREGRRKEGGGGGERREIKCERMRVLGPMDDLGNRCVSFGVLAKVLLSIVMPRLVSNPNLLGIPTLQWAMKEVMHAWEDFWLHELCVSVGAVGWVGAEVLMCVLHNQGSVQQAQGQFCCLDHQKNDEPAWPVAKENEQASGRGVARVHGFPAEASYILFFYTKSGSILKGACSCMFFFKCEGLIGIAVVHLIRISSNPYSMGVWLHKLLLIV